MDITDSSRTILDGLEQLRRWRDRIGLPPAVERLGIAVTDIGPEQTVTRMPLPPELLLPDGRPSAAPPAMLADFGLVTAIVGSLPRPGAAITISMTVDHLAPTPPSGVLVATCRAQPYADGGPQHAHGQIRDGDGRLVASMSGWFLPNHADLRAPAPPAGMVAEPAAAHLLDLLGVPQPAARDGDGVGFPLAVRHALTNVVGTLHGGAGAISALLAAEAALGPGARLLSSTYAYLRPAPAGSVVDVTARVHRKGRRTASVRSALTAHDGREALRVEVVAQPGAAAAPA